MTHLKALAGAAVLAAFVLCAIGAGSASATTTHVCTAEHLGEPTTPKFEDSSCTKSNETKGTFHLTQLKPGVPTNVVQNSKSSQTFSATIGGVKFSFVCEVLTSKGSFTNVEGPPMKTVGTFSPAEFTKCKVEEPAGKGCVVPETISTKALKAASQPMTEAEATKVRIEPESGETFMAFTVSGCTITALNGEKVVKGFAQAVVPEGNESTLEFSGSSGSSLSVGGASITYTGKIGTFMEGTTEPMVWRA
ncbi:MAG TPA: hypothetical protein VHZ54_12710 [Solirubrobacterales bacterium]|jgi:hypothetical protein|nr:hypothetical protein [Solirubrobacterales bacterium]